MNILDILSVIGNTAAIYIVVLVGLRILGKKDMGELSVTDILLVMLVSEAVGDVMRASNDSLWSGIISAATLVLLNRLFNVLMYRLPKLGHLIDGNPAVLVRNGKPNFKEMKRNRITLSELEQSGREQGKGSIDEITLAILEVNGKISILDTDKLKTNGPVCE